MQLILPFILKLGCDLKSQWTLNHISAVYIYVAVLCHLACISECKAGLVGAFMF